MIARPSLETPREACGPCHASIVAGYDSTLHKTVQGFVNTVSLRAGRDIAADSAVSDHFGCPRRPGAHYDYRFAGPIGSGRHHRPRW